ncbi:hypothetical protein [Serratia sp. Se-RSBMAAmG]|uniref:hypothetical protein n=1 Tax=Serratia sp. Se-RSBMAAmG TaxID=3043305 RepID=UPI0024AFBC81|nr:hypothetical protein [Serratia sp. Se-RSBMAAmG]MDI6977262.1 hypothetical protein [Serratia sp. Se-RSBMAAmG]
MNIKPFAMVMVNLNGEWMLESVEAIRLYNANETEAEKDMRELTCYADWKSGLLPSDSEVGVFVVKGAGDLDKVYSVSGKLMSDKDIDVRCMLKCQKDFSFMVKDEGINFSALEADQFTANANEFKCDQVIVLNNCMFGYILDIDNPSKPDERKVWYVEINEGSKYKLKDDLFSVDDLKSLENTSAVCIGCIVP